MKRIAYTFALMLAAWIALPVQAQITSAQERIRRQTLNARESLSVKEVKANQFDLKGKMFLVRLFVRPEHDVEQLEANRWEVWIESEQGGGGVEQAHLPRAGMEALGRTILPGDSVIARIKEGEATLTLEILGVSAVGVWE